MARLESEEFERVKGIVAARISELRRGKGLSQEELADQAGVHRTYVGMLERQRANPSLQVLVSLADALDVTVEVLMAN